MSKVKKKESASIKNIITLPTKLGELEINLDHAIHFPQGIIGMPEYKDFCLANIGDEKFKAFKAMQCINDINLTFLILPIDLEHNYLDAKDFEDAIRFLNLDPTSVAQVLIASTKIIDEKKKIIVNSRAPIFIDTNGKKAFQYVLPNNRYDIQLVV